MRKTTILYLVLMLCLLSTSVVVAAEHNPLSRIQWDEDWPTFYDPAVGTDYSDTQTMSQIHDALVFPNDDGSVRPWLATDWEVSEDGLTYTFHLREGVKFHTGGTMKASDVVFSFNRLQTIGEGLSYLYRTTDAEGNVVSGVKSISAPDDMTVVFELAKPFGPFLSSLVRFYVVSEEAVMANVDMSGKSYGEGLGDLGKKWYLTNDAGTGPYTVIEVKPESHVSCEKFDDWWVGWEENSPDFFKMIAAPGEVTIMTLMKNKEQEITNEFMTREGYDALAQLPNVEVVDYFVGQNLQVMMNTKMPPTDDIHFRKAMSYILDYDAINEQIWPTNKQAVGPVPFDLPGHNPNIVPYTRDVEKAKEELAKSKYADQLDQYPFTLSWCAEVPDEEKLALLIQANAAELGITVEISKKPFGSMIDDAQSIETTPSGSVVYCAAPYAEAIAMLQIRYSSKSVGTPDQMEWLLDDEIDALIEDAISTLDQDERNQKAMKIQEMINDLAPTLFVSDKGEQRGVQDYIYWPTVDKAKSGEPISVIQGYFNYVPSMKVFVDKR